MNRKNVMGLALVVCLVCGIAATPVSAATMTMLGSDADTYLRDATVRGALDFMDVRGGTIDFRGYLRFDLSSLGPNAVIQTASLKLTIHGGPGASRNDAITTGRFAAYGLNNVVGNTSQSWDESTFVPAAKGTEDVTTLTGVSDLDGDVPGMSEVVVGGQPAGSTVTISGAPLVAFLQSRVDDGGLATLILSNDDATDRGYGLATKEHANTGYRPMLTLTFLVPEPASAVLMLAAMFGLSNVRRKGGRS